LSTSTAAMTPAHSMASSSGVVVVASAEIAGEFATEGATAGAGLTEIATVADPVKPSSEFFSEILSEAEPVKPGVGV